MQNIIFIKPVKIKRFELLSETYIFWPSTTEINAVIKQIGYSVCQVINIIYKSTKRSLPLFFVDFKTAKINNEFFKLISLLHTKIKFEILHKRREIILFFNCQEYGHLKGYPSRCVQCADFSPTLQGSKPNATPPTCALCGDHTANYRDCPVHKNLQRSSPKPNIVSKNHANKYSIVNKQKADPCDRPHPNPFNISDKKSFPNLTQNSHHNCYPNKTNPHHTPQINSYDNIWSDQLYTAYFFYFFIFWYRL